MHEGRELPAAPAGKSGWPWTGEGAPLPRSAPDGRPWPRVTLVTPSLNQGRFIEATIRSVLLQGYPNLEYIIIDGGSSDNSLEIIRRYEPWLACWVSEKDQGQTEAINKGFGHSTGQYLNWLNSDDCLAPGALQCVAEGFRADPHADFVYGDTQIILEDGTIFQTRLETSYHPWILRYAANLFVQSSCFFKREIAERLNWFDPVLHWAMDYDFWIRAAAIGAIFRQTKGVISQFRLHTDSKTGSGYSHLWQEVYQCHRHSTQNVLLRSKSVFVGLQFFFRFWRIVKLYRERRFWQPGRVGRLVRRLNRGVSP